MTRYSIWSLARNGLLPLLTLDYTYNVNGLGDSWNDSFSMVGDKDFEDHTVGMRLEVPVGNEAARKMLERYQAPDMPGFEAERLNAFVSTRRARYRSLQDA